MQPDTSLPRRLFATFGLLLHHHQQQQQRSAGIIPLLKTFGEIYYKWRLCE